MGCCGLGIPVLEEDQPLIIDINKILTDKTWNNFKYSRGYFSRKCLKRSNFIIEVPENYFVFEQVEQAITNPGRGVSEAASSANNNAANPSATDMLKNKVPSNRQSNPESVSLDTQFSNDTAQKQTYQFKFSKTKTTRVEVSFQKGFTVGGKASFSIGLPKVLGDGSIGLESEMHYEITKSEGQSFEESMNMEATSDISVGPKSNYVANVLLEERVIHATFQVRTRMSMPQKKAPIYIYRKSDKALVYVFNVKNLKDVFIGETPSAEKVKEGERFAEDKIDFVIEGVMKGSLACDHRINLSSDETEDEKNQAKLKYLRADDD